MGSRAACASANSRREEGRVEESNGRMINDNLCKSEAPLLSFSLLLLLSLTFHLTLL